MTKKNWNTLKKWLKEDNIDTTTQTGRIVRATMKMVLTEMEKIEKGEI